METFERDIKIAFFEYDLLGGIDWHVQDLDSSESYFFSVLSFIDDYLVFIHEGKPTIAFNNCRVLTENAKAILTSYIMREMSKENDKLVEKTFVCEDMA